MKKILLASVIAFSLYSCSSSDDSPESDITPVPVEETNNDDQNTDDDGDTNSEDQNTDDNEVPVEETNNDDQNTGDDGNTNAEDGETTEDNTPLITFARNILPIIQNNCIPCHGQNGSQTNYTDFRNARNNAAGISDRINRTPGSPGFMPRGRATSLTQTELDLIAQWITDGRLEE